MEGRFGERKNVARVRRAQKFLKRYVKEEETQLSVIL